MSKLLFQTQPFNHLQTIYCDSTSLIKQLRQIFIQNFQKIQKIVQDQRVLNLMKNNENEIQKFLITKINILHIKQFINNTYNNEQNQDEIDFNNYSHQPSYLFLRNLWQGKYFNKRPLKQSTQDQLDKINKMVAMMKTRISFMHKKQSYLYEKQLQQDKKKYQDKKNMIDNLQIFSQQEQNVLKNQYIYSHPIFMRVKEQLEKLKMEKQQSQMKIFKQEGKIDKLQKEKKQIQILYQHLKKKNQQTQIKLIQISKKNINLQQQILSIKSLNQKLKLQDSKQNSSPYSFSYFSKHNSGQKLEQQNENELNIYRNNLNQYGIQSIFSEVKIQRRLTFTQKQFPNLSYQNEQRQILKQNINQNNTHLNTIHIHSQQQLLPSKTMRFKYIKPHQNNNSNRKTLLSSVKSVDINNNTSISKPKFQRTKQNFNHLIKKQTNQNHIKNSNQKLFQRLKKKAIGQNQKNFISPNKQYYTKPEINY